MDIGGHEKLLAGFGKSQRVALHRNSRFNSSSKKDSRLNHKSGQSIIEIGYNFALILKTGEERIGQMKVELLEHTPQSDLLAAAAAHSCRSERGASKLKETESDEKLKKILRKTVERGHTSVVEHASFTFSVEGISRACSHQLVRHRIASYSQQSQRHVKPDEEKYVIPPSIESEPSAREEFQETMKRAWNAYEKLVGEEIPREDSRFVLPNATPTNIVVTMNGRSLLNFFELRTCTHAQWEIRAVANKMLREVKEVAPPIFEDAGPPCKRKEICPEDDQDCKLYEKYIES